MLLYILLALGGLVIGGGLCFLIMRFTSLSILRKAEEEAEIIKKNKIVEAKEKFIALKLEHENQVRQDEQRKQQREQQLNQREQQLNQRQGDIQRSLNDYNQKAQQLEQQSPIVIINDLISL